MRALELDWDDTYERIRRVLQRISKRAEALEKAEARSEGARTREVPADDVPAASVSGLDARLTPRQRELQQAILRRRAGG